MPLDVLTLTTLLLLNLILFAYVYWLLRLLRNNSLLHLPP